MPPVVAPSTTPTRVGAAATSSRLSASASAVAISAKRSERESRRRSGAGSHGRRREVLDLGGDSAPIAGGVEAGDRRDGTGAGAQRRDERGDGMGERIHRTEAGDDDGCGDSSGRVPGDHPLTPPGIARR